MLPVRPDFFLKFRRFTDKWTKLSREIIIFGFTSFKQLSETLYFLFRNLSPPENPDGDFIDKNPNVAKERWRKEQCPVLHNTS